MWKAEALEIEPGVALGSAPTMQFHQAAGGKVRPALVLLDTGDDDFVAAPITSQSRHSDYDLAMEDW